MTFPNLWLTIAQLMIVSLTIFLAWMTYRTNLLLKTYRPPFNVLLSVPETFSRLALVGICFFLAWLTGLSAEQLGFVLPFPRQSIIIGVSVGITTQFTINLVALWAVKQYGKHIYSPWLVWNILPRRPIEWLLVALAFIPAVLMEELLFRSLLIGAFFDTVPMWLLIAVTSVLFGFMHQPQGVLGMVGAGVMNILFSVLFVWSGELLVPFVTHYTINMMQLIAANYQRDWLYDFSESVNEWPEPT
ncbi:CPBP family intramembrane metalloprotease [Anaerolineales bacterium HSG6]|nr:CPBP family intramembrane metalloprotease [Anaerolineales bacterium HSG6]